eukprot:GHVQ01030544.1.p1 GENE.GHVQ01030544.1~~GHVQ01030544.1.p1  ORF type:complete len:580 (+),score=62.52 GHVQ01030544.1:322-2061(+)
MEFQSDRLDAEFAMILTCIEVNSPTLSKHLRIRCGKWVGKLIEENSNETMRRNRNVHGQLLLLGVLENTWHPPLDKNPPEGPINSLPTYLSCMLKQKMAKSRCVSAGAVSTPMNYNALSSSSTSWSPITETTCNEQIRTLQTNQPECCEPSLWSSCSTLSNMLCGVQKTLNREESYETSCRRTSYESQEFMDIANSSHIEQAFLERVQATPAGKNVERFSQNLQNIPENITVTEKSCGAFLGFASSNSCEKYEESCRSNNNTKKDLLLMRNKIRDMERSFHHLQQQLRPTVEKSRTASAAQQCMQEENKDPRNRQIAHQGSPTSPTQGSSNDECRPTRQCAVTEHASSEHVPVTGSGNLLSQEHVSSHTKKRQKSLARRSRSRSIRCERHSARLPGTADQQDQQASESEREVISIPAEHEADTSTHLFAEVLPTERLTTSEGQGLRSGRALETLAESDSDHFLCNIQPIDPLPMGQSIVQEIMECLSNSDTTVAHIGKATSFNNNNELSETCNSCVEGIVIAEQVEALTSDGFLSYPERNTETTGSDGVVSKPSTEPNVARVPTETVDDFLCYLKSFQV